MLNGLDLFSGIGGIALALAPWVRPVAYCEIDRYAQGVLVSQMAAGRLPVAPIWDDVRTLHRGIIAGHTKGQHDDGESVDIITGGFPCQDISIAGAGAGLAGERSGLFYEIVRLCGELRPEFVFLENVPAITSRGGRDVVGAFASLGYDCRWCVISAASIGANHVRERWFLLAHAAGVGRSTRSGDGNGINTAAGTVRASEFTGSSGGVIEDVSHAESQGLPNWRQNQGQYAPAQKEQTWGNLPGLERCGGSWWAVEPDVGRVAHGIPCRVDRIKCLGNAVVPLQPRVAFQILSGIGVEAAGYDVVVRE